MQVIGITVRMVQRVNGRFTLNFINIAGGESQRLSRLPVFRLQSTESTAAQMAACLY